jgi:hypothetical protein
MERRLDMEDIFQERPLNFRVALADKGCDSISGINWFRE